MSEVAPVSRAPRAFLGRNRRRHPLADVRNRLSERVAEVEQTHERISITKRGHPAAVLQSPGDLASIEETLDILSDADALANIREAEGEAAQGEYTSAEHMALPIEERRRCVRERYELRLYCPARRALEEHLALAVALAVWAFCNGPLRGEPRRVGRPLSPELAGYFSARRGAYRVIYRLDEVAMSSTVFSSSDGRPGRRWREVQRRRMRRRCQLRIIFEVTRNAT